MTIGEVQADCTVTKAYCQNTDYDHWGLEKELFPLLSGFENAPLLSQGRSDHSGRAGAGGGRDHGDSVGRRPRPSLRTARCVTNCTWSLPFLPGELRPASRQAGTGRHKGATRLMRSSTKNRGIERRTETAVLGRLFLQRVYHYWVLGKHRSWPYRSPKRG